MKLFRLSAAAAAMLATASIGPVAMAASTQDQSSLMQLVRGGGGGFHGGGFHGGYRSFAYNHRFGYGVGGFPYVYNCLYPYTYPFCTWPNG